MKNLKKKLEDLQMQYGVHTPVQLFEQIFNDDMFELIQVETLRYAKDVKNNQLFSMSVNELKAFIGVLIYSGYCKLPSEKLYWSEADDVNFPIVRKAITKTKYMKIKSYLHVQDNSKLQRGTSDRGFKVRPLLDLVNHSFSKFGVFHKQLAVDEMMVKYYGHHGLKQFIRGKPIRFGYKLWAICGDDGYCYKFDLYCGKDQRPEFQCQPLGTRVVLDMISIISEPNNHIVYFDNLFTSRSLMETLKDRGIRATGTARENRLDKCPVTPANVISKSKRGTYEKYFDKTAEVLVVRWHDNKVVNVMTNHDVAEPVSTTSRYDRTLHKKVDVPQPRVFANYNAGMGGVDHHDWLLCHYQINIRGKKWYWCLITRVIDMCLVNSWLLYRATTSDAKKLTLLEFRRDIATTYLKASKQTTVISSPSQNPVSLRYDGVGHLPTSLDGRRRCQLESCQLRTTKKCCKCNVPICMKCFVKYHSRN